KAVPYLLRAILPKPAVPTLPASPEPPMTTAPTEPLAPVPEAATAPGPARAPRSVWRAFRIAQDTDLAAIDRQSMMGDPVYRLLGGGPDRATDNCFVRADAWTDAVEGETGATMGRIFVTNVNGRPVLNDWAYHVAPVIRAETGDLWVLDPAFF